MKSWAIAIASSVALHLGVVAMLGREAGAAQVLVRAEEQLAVKGEVVSFTPVSMLPRADPAPAPAPPSPAPAPPSPAPPKARRPEPVLKVSEGGPSSLPRSPLPEGQGAGDVKAESAADNVSKKEGDSFVTEAVIVGPSPEVIALVHARLAAAAEGCYPPVARRFQQRGTVQLSFCTNASGGTASSSVTISSGAEVLDAAARGCVVERASPFPAVAASRCFSVPVRFGAR